MGGREGWGWGLLPLIQDGEGALGLQRGVGVWEGLAGGQCRLAVSWHHPLPLLSGPVSLPAWSSTTCSCLL